MIKKLVDYPVLFLFLGLVFGVQMIFVNPPWQSNDEDRHFYNAYALSEGDIAPKVKNGRIGQYLPSNLVDNVRSFQGIVITDQNKFNKELISNLTDTENNTDNKVFNENPTSNILPFAYFPSALTISLAKSLHRSPMEIGWYGRIGALLAYLLIVFFALRRMPCYQPLLMAVALSPMALYQATSVSYDALSFAFLFFYFALVVQFFFQKQPITTRQILLLIAIAFLQRLSKDGYFILYFSALVLPLSRFQMKRNYMLMIGGLILAAYLPGFLWNTYLRTLDLPEGAVSFFQKDFVFDGGKNIQYHLTQPFHTIYLGFANLLVQGKDWMTGAVGRFGYSYTVLPEYLIIASWLLILSAGLVENKVYRIRFSMVMLFSGLLGLAAVIYGFLFLGSPVGADSIFGLQGRYFTPILPFVIAGAMQWHVVDLSDSMKKIILVSALTIILWITIRFLDKTFYI